MKGLVATISIAIVLLWLGACSSQSALPTATVVPTPLVRFTWEATPNTRLLLATDCCASPTTEELVRFYIPEAQLWGGGRFLWTRQDAEGARQVFSTRLSDDEIQALLQEIAAAGFFGWDERYEGEPVVDAAGKCLTVTLADREKTVCETHGGAPDSFYTLFVHLSQGAGTSGRLYRPERAFVTGFHLEDPPGPRPAAELTWEETQVEGPATRILSGFWVEGDPALRILWDAANQNPYHMPLVEDGERLYRIMLQVPGVSWIDPE